MSSFTAEGEADIAAAIENVPIERMGLKIRTVNALRRNNLYTVGDVSRRQQERRLEVLYHVGKLAVADWNAGLDRLRQHYLKDPPQPL